MEINNLKTKHIELTDAIRSHLDKRLATIEKLLDPNDTSIVCDVELSKTTEHHQSGPIFYAETNLTIGGEKYRATAQEESLYAAIDEMKGELRKEIRRRKRKKEHLFRRGANRIKNIVRGFGDRVQ